MRSLTTWTNANNRFAGIKTINRLRRMVQVECRGDNPHANFVGLSIFQFERSRYKEGMHAVAYTCIEQTLTETICLNRGDLEIVGVNIDADRRVRLARIPRPSDNLVTVGAIVKAFKGTDRAIDDLRIIPQTAEGAGEAYR